ncbi:MAG: hypothetical protein HPY53_15405 [Brevinematales bacterium]|nr:hypothetical protein [Brevinematales bacterium]
MLKKILLFISITVVLAGTGYGVQKEVKFTQPIDVIATGGAGIADTARFGIIFMNPAALGVNQIKGFSVLKVGLRANLSLYDLAMLGMRLSQGETSLAALTDAEWQSILNLKSTIGITGPLMLGYIGSGLGLLLYDDIFTSVTVKQAPGLPYVEFATYADIGFTVGYGFELPMPFFLGKFTRVYGGINLKYLNRMKYVDDRMSLVEAFDMGTSIANFQKGFLMGQNISSDVGILVKMLDFSIGLVCRDWFSTGFNWSEYDINFQKNESAPVYEASYFSPALDVGIDLHLDFGNFLINSMEIYFDVVNSVDFSESYLLKLRLGTEVKFFTFLIARAGLYKGYPTLGIGIDLPVLKINAAYYIEELGNLPGTIPQPNVMVDFQILL